MFKCESGNVAVQVSPNLEFTETAQEINSGDPGVGTFTVHNYENDTGEVLYHIYHFDLPPELTADPSAAQGTMNGIRDAWIESTKGH